MSPHYFWHSYHVIFLHNIALNIHEIFVKHIHPTDVTQASLRDCCLHGDLRVRSQAGNCENCARATCINIVVLLGLSDFNNLK